MSERKNSKGKAMQHPPIPPAGGTKAQQKVMNLIQDPAAAKRLLKSSGDVSTAKEVPLKGSVGLPRPRVLNPCKFCGVKKPNHLGGECFQNPKNVKAQQGHATTVGPPVPNPVNRGAQFKMKGPAKKTMFQMGRAAAASKSALRVASGGAAPKLMHFFNMVQTGLAATPKKMGSSSHEYTPSAIMDRMNNYKGEHNPGQKKFKMPSGVMADIVERVEGPAAEIGKRYAYGICNPLIAPPCAVPDVKMYRTGLLKYPTKVSANTVQSSGTDTSYFTDIMVTPMSKQLVTKSTTFVNGVSTVVANTDDENQTYLAATNIAQRVTTLGVRVRNTTAAVNRQGRWAVLRLPFASVPANLALAFGTLESYPDAQTGDFAEQASFVYPWVPAGPTDIALISPTATVASDNTVIWILCNAAAAQTIEVDVVPCYEYRAIVASEVALPVAVAIGDEGAAAEYLALAMQSGVLHNTVDSLDGAPIMGWAGCSPLPQVGAPQGGGVAAGVASGSRKVGAAAQTEKRYYQTEEVAKALKNVFKQWYHEDKNGVYLTQKDLDEMRKDPGNAFSSTLDSMMGLAKDVIVAGVDAGMAAVGTAVVVSKWVDRMLAFTSSLDMEQFVELQDTLSKGLLPEEFVAAWSALFKFNVIFGSNGVDITCHSEEGAKDYVLSWRPQRYDPLGREVEKRRLYLNDGTICPVCPEGFCNGGEQHLMLAKTFKVHSNNPCPMCPPEQCVEKSRVTYLEAAMAQARVDLAQASGELAALNAAVVPPIQNVPLPPIPGPPGCEDDLKEESESPVLVSPKGKKLSYAAAAGPPASRLLNSCKHGKSYCTECDLPKVQVEKSRKAQ